MNIPRTGERCKHGITLEHCAACRPRLPRPEWSPPQDRAAEEPPSLPDPVTPAEPPPPTAPRNGRRLTSAERSEVMRKSWAARRDRRAAPVADPFAHLRERPPDRAAAEPVVLPGPPPLITSEAEWFAEARALKLAYDRATAPLRESIDRLQAELATVQERFTERSRLMAEELLRLPSDRTTVESTWCQCGHLLRDHSRKPGTEGRCTAGSDGGGCLCASPRPAP